MKWSSSIASAIIISCGMVVVTPAVYAKQLGTVNFHISCKKSSQMQFNDALALVHHMMYIQAEKKFQKIVQNDPNCAMAYWGIALTQTHPLWGAKPTKAAISKGAAALKKAQSFHTTTKREQAFINALRPLYVNWQKIPYRKRLVAWEKAQSAVFKKYPNDADAAALYALAHLAIASKKDKTYSNQEAAGKILENMHQKNPMHPAGYHYTIHAYDNPKLAHKGETYARKYSNIAPDVPHALHMPSHIFVRLGQWPETISWNIRSAAAAKRQALKDGVMSMHYAHAMDYLMYAYLQTGRDKLAAKVLQKVKAVKKYQDSFATAYGVAAARARFYLEQKLWSQAAKMKLQQPKSFPWHKYPSVESIIYFAQGFGAVKTGNYNQVKTIIEKLKNIDAVLQKRKRGYWAVLVRSRQQTLMAWLEFARGNKANALRLMKSSADLEDSVDKHPVTPGEVLPARELLGDMLMQLNQPKQALIAYQAALKISPNRFNSIYGAGLAAEKIGNKQLALKYYKKLLILTKKADTKLPEIEHAKQFVKQAE